MFRKWKWTLWTMFLKCSGQCFEVKVVDILSRLLQETKQCVESEWEWFEVALILHFCRVWHFAQFSDWSSASLVLRESGFSVLIQKVYGEKVRKVETTAASSSTMHMGLLMGMIFRKWKQTGIIFGKWTISEKPRPPHVAKDWITNVTQSGRPNKCNVEKFCR
jgi:hypothetical protein